MKKEIIVCDKCETEITGRMVVIVKSFVEDGKECDKKNIDLCPKCYNEFSDWLKGSATETLSPEEEVEAADELTEKILKLHEAGKSYKEIAEECGCTTSMVGNRIHRHKTKKENDPKKKTKAAKETTAPKRIPRDVGKVKALYKAGWDAKKIAEEVGST